jgi:hypothetical protein
MKFAVLATFEVMHGRKSTMEELILRLQPFSRESVLYLSSVIGMVLKLWERGGWDKSYYELLLRAVFEPLRADWYCLSARATNPELVFYRRQLLLIMKLAVEHCPERGMDVLHASPGYFGTICLMANDRSDYGLHMSVTHRPMDREKIMRLLTEFVPVTEYGGSRIETRIVRSHLMMTRHTQACRLHPDFVDVAAEFEEEIGISLEEYEALAFGLFTRCSAIDLSALQQSAWVAAVRKEHFYTTAIDRRVIDRFLEEFTIDPSSALTRIQKRDFGVNDFTVFRDKPLISEWYGLLPADLLFVAEKFEAGPYWRVNSLSTEIGNKLRRFWGAVFESYVNEQIEDACKTAGAAFAADPRHPDNEAIQVCDAVLLEGTSLVVMEYKSSMFSAGAKYSGDHLLLQREIVTKLVGDAAEGKKKGVEQLAHAIRQFLTIGSSKAIFGLDLSGVKKVYPLLVTLDDFGGTLLLSTFLNTYFDGLLDRSSFDNIQICPLFGTDIESLELVLPSCDSLHLSGFLQHWLDSDPLLKGTVLAFLPKGVRYKRNRILESEWKILSARIQRLLFPKEYDSQIVCPDEIG